MGNHQCVEFSRQLIEWNQVILLQIGQAPANLMLLKGSSVVGVFWGRFAEEEPEANARNTAELIRLLHAGELKPHVSATYPLEQTAKALNLVAARRVLGKIVIEI